jgi:hypothetical protein
MCVYIDNLRQRRSSRRGVAYMLSLIILVLCASLAVGMASSTGMNLARVDNMQKTLKAQLVAEDGLQFMLQTMSSVELPRDTDYDTLMSNLTTKLGEILDDTPNLGESLVSGTDSTVTIPTITLGDATFTVVLTRLSPNAADNQQCRLSVTGSTGGMSRSISINLVLTETPPPIFGYGVASKGTIDISGNAKLLAMSEAEHASIFSASDDSTVITASGNARLAGDLYACADDITAINLTGNVSVGGETNPDDIAAEHTHLGMDDPEFPEFDLTPFPALATTVVDGATQTMGNKTFNNIHVLPNINPTFAGNITINGIAYIEAPNKVKFLGNLVINGFIVTSDGSSLPLAGNQLTFSGNVSVPGVDALPDTAEFAAVKAQRGTAVLAPGFGITFSGNNSGINGLVAADQITFRGNSSLGGELTGMILGFADLPMSLRGNTTVTFNREEGDYLPTGFKYTASFSVINNSYTEYTD